MTTCRTFLLLASALFCLAACSTTQKAPYVSDGKEPGDLAERMSLVRDVAIRPRAFDKVCPECHRRLSFLEFVAAARAFHQKEGAPAS